ncbi:MAG: hypothetical protein IPP85_04310 [Propionivibrio sp.]|nr:hypothetical protein [Propionivibrio sp.]
MALWPHQNNPVRRFWYFSATVLFALGLWAWYKHQKSFDTNPADIPPYQKVCSISRIQPVGKLPREKCIHGPDKMHPKVLLWGDSHAGHMMPMLMEAFSDVAVYQLTMAACVPVIGYEALAPETPKFCPEFNQRVLQEIKDLKKRWAGGRRYFGTMAKAPVAR